MKHFIHDNGDLRIESPKLGVVTRERFRFHFRNIETTKELRANLRAGGFAWPGGYPLYFITNDGESMCFDCVKEEYRRESRAVRDKTRDRIAFCEVNWESALFCRDCQKPIEAAYDIVEEGE